MGNEMGLFDSVKSLIKASVDTAILPVEAVKDIVTADCMFPGESDSPKRLEKIKERLQDAYDSIDD